MVHILQQIVKSYNLQGIELREYRMASVTLVDRPT